MRVRIAERGNGWPEVGDYVDGPEGVYRIVSLLDTIHTRQVGGNYIYGEVEPADWDDVPEGVEPIASAEVV